MDCSWILSLVLLVIFITCDVISPLETPPEDHGQISAEKRLMRKLMSSYQAVGELGRPVRNISSVVNVTFGMGLIQMELNEKDKILTMSMWTRYIWRDEYLQWDPGEYEGLQSVKIDPRTIWQPDIMLYNTADVDIEQREALAVLRYSGVITWWPHSIFKATCSVDVTNYPFDQQECHMMFGSWTHKANEIDIQMGHPTGIDLSTFQSDHRNSSAWGVVHINASKTYMPAHSPPENAFSVLIFVIALRRKVVFLSYILTLPCVFLSCLTLVVFWLPPERPDRTALAMSVFSSFMVLLLILVEAAPPTASSIPNLGVYYCFNMTIISLSIVFSSLVINVGKSTRFKEKRLPSWARLLFIECLGRAFCVKIESLEKYTCWNDICTSCCMSLNKSGTSVSQPVINHRDIYWNQMGPQISSPHKEQNTQNKQNTNNITFKYCQTETRDDFEIAPRETSEVTSLLHKEVILIHNILHRMEENISEKQGIKRQDNGAVKEWKDCAAVLDRLFFFLYLILIALSLILYFPRPQLYQ